MTHHSYINQNMQVTQYTSQMALFDGYVLTQNVSKNLIVVAFVEMELVSCEENAYEAKAVDGKLEENETDNCELKEDKVGEGEYKEAKTDDGEMKEAMPKLSMVSDRRPNLSVVKEGDVSWQCRLTLEVMKRRRSNSALDKRRRLHEVSSGKGDKDEAIR